MTFRDLRRRCPMWTSTTLLSGSKCMSQTISSSVVRRTTFSLLAGDYRENGMVYSLDRGQVRGVLLWNTWGHFDAARQLIAAPGPCTAKSLKGCLPA